jgi:hypothetical protein
MNGLVMVLNPLSSARLWCPDTQNKQFCCPLPSQFNVRGGGFVYESETSWMLESKGCGMLQAFCAGGDVKTAVQAITANNPLAAKSWASYTHTLTVSYSNTFDINPESRP